MKKKEELVEIITSFFIVLNLIGNLDTYLCYGQSVE